MIKITVDDLLNNCNAKLLIGSRKQVINECFIDSKKVTKGSCFFGISGKNVDGSLYYKEAFNNGACVCVISKIINLDLNGYDDKTVIIADDPKMVLQDLARYKRSLFDGDVIGITGSVGKTSTKEIVSSVLEKKYKVLKTSGNQNSQLGLPLTILRLTDEEVMVLEMGMSKALEMHNLSLIAKPTISVITNVYDSHIGNLGSKENILKAKLEILDGMNDGTLIINNDNDMLKKVSDNIKDNINVMSVGINTTSNIMPTEIINDIKTKFAIGDVKDLEISGGTAFVYNALVAFLIGKLLGVSRSMLKLGINEYSNVKHRLELVNLNGNVTLIDDTYNASYDSVKNALEYMNNFDGKKILILGDILELGKESKKIHKKIGELVANNNVNELVTIGKYSKYIDKKARKNGMKRKYIKHFKTEAKAKKYVRSLITTGSVLLVKGSNGVNLINLVNFLKNGY